MLRRAVYIAVALLTFFVALPAKTEAQCSGRYLDTLSFPGVDSFMNIAYSFTAGGSDTELMNIYQPHGDTACRRHLLILAHGGAFFQGSKNDPDITFFCYHMAMRGYVCVSPNYRLASALYDLYDSAQIFTYAWKAFSDMKAVIRYFYKDAAGSNNWNIDTGKIFIGGSSAGAIASDFIATLDSVNELPPAFQAIAIANGGIEGNSGNAGYSSHVAGVASLAGAVNSLAWIKPGQAPMLLCQGTSDGTVPYYCGLALTQYTLGLYPTIHFCGSGAMAPQLASNGTAYSLLPFPGAGHVPWDTNTAIGFSTDSAMAAFFYQINCAQEEGRCHEPSALSSVIKDQSISVFPNPAAGRAEIVAESGLMILNISLTDYYGRDLNCKWNYTGNAAIISLETLCSGIYWLQITLRGSERPVMKKLIVQ